MEPRHHGPERSWLRECSWLLPPLVAGAFLRLFGLGRQVLGGDEFHAIRIAARNPLGTILTEYSTGSDHCIPLSAGYRLYTDLVGPLTETVLRAPVVLSGLLLVAIFPLFAARWFGRFTAGVLAWLLAISPVLVMYGRIVRSYSPMVLLGALAIAFFIEWVRNGRRRDAWLYAGCAGLAVYFHLLAAPFVLAPLLVAGVELVLRRDRAPSAEALVRVAGLVVLFLAIFLVPCAPSLIEFVRSKSAGGSIDSSTLLLTLQHHAGVRHALPAVAFWAAAIAGVVLSLRSEWRVAVYFVVPAAIQLLAVAVARPELVEQLLVISRYLMIALPGACLLVAVALTVPWSERWSTRARTTQRVVAVAFVAVLYATGGIGRVGERFAGSFAHNIRSLEFVVASDATEREVPALYSRLAASAGDDAPLVEFPVEYAWRFATAPDVYQRTHGRDVLVSSAWNMYADPRLALANTLPMDPDAYLASRARYLVLHRNPAAEEPLLEGERAERVRGDARHLETLLRREWGEPTRKDPLLLVWDLESLR